MHLMSEQTWMGSAMPNQQIVEQLLQLPAANGGARQEP